MCSIAGSVDLEATSFSRDQEAVVARMCDLQHHRGPDDRGVVRSGGVVLGSNRLSIIDLSTAGHMPMSNADQTWWIVYNGEIFNFQAIRSELSQMGYEFRSRTDTEVVLHALEEWGEKGLDRFVGMFGLAVYDCRRDRLMLARDRFGKKPLYYGFEQGQLLFASELKALAAVKTGLTPNLTRLMEWSLYRNTDFGSRDTLIEGIYSLPPGHYMVVARGRAEKPVCYYSPEREVGEENYKRLKRQPVSQTTAEIERLIVSGVNDRLVSDVPLGTLCSGGIDSSLITALTARKLPAVTAFNVSVAGYRSIDENAYAQRVTDWLGVRLATFSMTPSSFRENLPRAIYHNDGPLTHPNSVAFLLVSEFARREGVTILLSGEAADELFGGYVQRYRRIRQVATLKRIADLLPSRVRKLLSLAGYAADGVPITGFSEYEGLLRHTTSILDRFSREDLRLRSMEAYAFVKNEAERTVLAAMLADVTNFLTPLLSRLDRMSMAASVEARLPFLDHRLVGTVLNLPLSLRLHRAEDKWILKKVAARYLPNDIVYRRKLGFPLPLGDYIGTIADERLFKSGFCVEFLGMHERALLESVKDWVLNVNGFFNLLTLELWGRLFFMGETPETLRERWIQGGATVALPSGSACVPSTINYRN